MRVTFFSGGSHGAGHVVRAMALQQALARRSPDIAFSALLPPSPFLRRLGAAGIPVQVDPAALSSPDTAATSAVAEAIADSAPDVVVIDVFWVPLVFVPLPCPAWLLLRSVPPAWLRGPRQAPFQASRYARVLAIEPAPVLSSFEAVPPVVALSTMATTARAESVIDARRRLAALVGANVDSPLQVVVGAGLASDRAHLDAEAARRGGAWHIVDGLANDAHFPVAPLLRGADAVIAAPGYNIFWESRLLGFDERCTWVPIPRAIDDAAWRASLPADVRFDDNGADVVADLIARG